MNIIFASLLLYGHSNSNAKEINKAEKGSVILIGLLSSSKVGQNTHILK